MKTRILVICSVTLILGIWISNARTEIRSKPATDLDKLAFIAGSWERTTGKTRNEELWTAPNAGCMMGLMRQITDGKISVREYNLIEETPEGVFMSVKHLGPKMTDIPGRSITLKLTSLEGGKAIFENTGDGVLKKVIYGPVNGDSMYAGIEIFRNEKLMKIDMPYDRVKPK